MTVTTTTCPEQHLLQLHSPMDDWLQSASAVVLLDLDTALVKSYTKMLCILPAYQSHDQVHQMFGLYKVLHVNVVGLAQMAHVSRV